MDGGSEESYECVFVANDVAAISDWIIEETRPSTIRIVQDYDTWARDLLREMSVDEILRQLNVDVRRIRIVDMRSQKRIYDGATAFRTALSLRDPMVVLLMMTQVAMVFPYSVIAKTTFPRVVKDAGDNLCVNITEEGATVSKLFTVCNPDAALSSYRDVAVRLDVNTFRQDHVCVNVETGPLLP